MNYSAIDSVHERIIKKFEDGIFTMGKKCPLTKYYFERETISDFSISERTPEVCSSLMGYCKCKFLDVPESSRTREFFISCFTNDDVYNYIKDNISNFDRQFFKDLITTNEYATRFNKNCFAIMPLEYIDEEMCSLAILTTMGWSDTSWFYSVYERKLEALTADLWKLGARLYSRMSGVINKFLSITPKEYKDEEYYKEMCMCNFNVGMELDDNKGKIMDSIPKEVITKSFIIDLLVNNLKNVARFSEKALEIEFEYQKDEKIVCEKVWQYVVRLDGYLIRHIQLNDERINFFLSLYDKDSPEYRWGFKDSYKMYKKEKSEAGALERKPRRLEMETNDTVKRVLFHAAAYALDGENPCKAIEYEVNRKEDVNSSLIPIKYQGIVPLEYSKTHDTEEYLEMLYEEMGIEIIEEHDNLFYNVTIPDGWTVLRDGYWNYVKDDCGNTVIEYFYDPKFCDREAYVKTVNFTKGKQKTISK